MKTYAGIGSRQTPPDMCDSIVVLARALAHKGYTLRSGGAKGADTSFELGCDAGAGAKEIYLPWRGFNKNRSPLYDISPESLELARQFHPVWEKLSQPVRLLMARNGYQVLGPKLNEPVSFVTCWTPGANGSGGTGQALRIAKHYDIPIFDLAKEGTLEHLRQYI